MYPLLPGVVFKMLFSVTMRLVISIVLALGFQAAVAQSPVQASSADVNELMQAGTAAQQHGDDKSAIADFRKVLAMHPEMVEARIGLGVSLAATGQLDEAIDEDVRALSAAPDKTRVRMEPGRWRITKKPTCLTLREQFETIHQSSPENVPAAVLLGYVYIKLGREAEAVGFAHPSLNAGMRATWTSNTFSHSARSRPGTIKTAYRGWRSMRRRLIRRMPG